jgi:hypothetical protein
VKNRRSGFLILCLVAGLSVLLSGCTPVFAASKRPDKVVESFYRWYLSYPSNALSDGAYRSSEHLTEQFVERVDGILASFDRGGYDPFLCAQDIPESFAVDEAVVSGSRAHVVVHETWNGGTQYELVRDITVQLRLSDRQWRIVDVVCTGADELTDWLIFRDEEYGFQVKYPQDWTFKELEAKGPGVPDDWPVVRIVHFYPQLWAEELNSSGPPDPTQMTVVAPLQLEVCIGPIEQYRRAYPEPAKREVREYSGTTMVVEQDALSEQIALTRYVFQDPRNPDQRVVFSDMISGFADRANGNEAVAAIVPLAISSFEFVR